MDMSSFKKKYDKFYVAVYPVCVVLLFGLGVGYAWNGNWSGTMYCFVIGAISYATYRIAKKI